MSQVYNNKRIAKNTLFLYIRMLLIMGVSLYTSRIVLTALGIIDYGINNVVAGRASDILLMESRKIRLAGRLRPFPCYLMCICLLP